MPLSSLSYEMSELVDRFSWLICDSIHVFLPNTDNIRILTSLQKRHNGLSSVSNHQPHDCLLNRLFMRRSKKRSKFRVTGLCAGNSPVTVAWRQTLETTRFFKGLRWPVNSPHKWPVTRKMFPFDDVIMWLGSGDKNTICSCFSREISYNLHLVCLTNFKSHQPEGPMKFSNWQVTESFHGSCMFSLHLWTNFSWSHRTHVDKIWGGFLSLARSKPRLCSANHRTGYFSNLDCDWLSIDWVYSKQESENRPWSVLRAKKHGKAEGPIKNYRPALGFTMQCKLKT